MPGLLKDPVLTNDWHPVALSADLADGCVIAARILGEDVVLWRWAGEVRAWKDLCLHRGSKLSLGKVNDGNLVCAYHGWTYDEGGRCVLMPAHPEERPLSKAMVKTYAAKEGNGLIWTCLGNPAADVPVFPEWNDDSYRKIFCGPYRVRASGPRLVENFLDVAHLPIVHEGLLGDSAHAKIDEFDVNEGVDGLTSSGIRLWQPDPDGTGRGAPVVYTYKVFKPLTAYFAKESSKQGFSMMMSVTPLDETESIMWMTIAMNYAHEVPAEQLRAFQDKIVAQDMRVVESQRPELLPLDLQAELHLRSDRMAIAYRRWLRRLGLTFGTA